jgi:hypothetical protein
MSNIETVTDALEAFLHVVENRLALADPQGMLSSTQIDWMKAVTAALSLALAVVPAVAAESPVVDAAPSSTEPPVIPPSTPAV